MKYIKYFFFSFLNIILRLEIAFSYFERGIKLSENVTDEPTTRISTSLDMGICSCDLTNHCDYRCCCDNDCNSEDKKRWEEDDICLNYKKDRIDDFKCKNNKENFEFNKNKAGLSVKDHIHNIMCVQFDNSGDMGNFYLNENNKEDEDLNEDLKNWKDKFFKNNIAKNENACQYGDMTNLHIYKADSNGNCIKQNIHCLKPYETSCISKDINELNMFSFYNHTISYSINKDGKNVTYKDVPKNTIKNSILKKFKVQWESSNQTTKDLPFGYIQGNPIKITVENSDTVYENGFFIGMSNRRGLCAKEFSEVSNPTPILFKRNAMFSCRMDSDLQSTYIYRSFINQKLIIGKSINSTSVVTLEKLSDSDNSIFNNANNDNDILMYLIIFTTKSGKENSPYEYIEHAKLKAKKKPSQSKRPILSLIIKYVELSYSSISNSKERKPTSLIPFSEEILNELSGKSEKK